MFYFFDSTTPSPMSDRFALLLGATPPVQAGSLDIDILIIALIEIILVFNWQNNLIYPFHLFPNFCTLTPDICHLTSI